MPTDGAGHRARRSENENLHESYVISQRAEPTGKLFLKVFVRGPDYRVLKITKSTTVRDAIRHLLRKCPMFTPNETWTLVEQLPALQMERIVEDHQLLASSLGCGHEASYRIAFVQVEEKYKMCGRKKDLRTMFAHRSGLLLSAGIGQERERLEAFPCLVPRVAGKVYWKAGGEKSWRKVYATLNDEGVYAGRKSAYDGELIANLKDRDVFYSTADWTKSLKAPTAYGFALKNRAVLSESRDIKYFSCDDRRSLQMWVSAIRLVKYGYALSYNYARTFEFDEEGQEGASDLSAISQNASSFGSASAHLSTLTSTSASDANFTVSHSPLTSTPARTGHPDDRDATDLSGSFIPISSFPSPSRLVGAATTAASDGDAIERRNLSVSFDGCTAESAHGASVSFSLYTGWPATSLIQPSEDAFLIRPPVGFRSPPLSISTNCRASGGEKRENAKLRNAARRRSSSATPQFLSELRALFANRNLSNPERTIDRGSPLSERQGAAGDLPRKNTLPLGFRPRVLAFLYETKADAEEDERPPPLSAAGDSEAQSSVYECGPIAAAAAVFQ